MLRKLKEEKFSPQLLEVASEELEAGRLRGPLDLCKLDLNECAIATRFGVDQGKPLKSVMLARAFLTASWSLRTQG